MVNTPPLPPSSLDSNTCGAWYASQDWANLDVIPMGETEPIAWFTPEEMPLPDSDDDPGPSASARISDNEQDAADVLLQDIDDEIVHFASISPFVFNLSTQLAIQSAGPIEGGDDSSPWVLRSPTPHEYEVGPGPLPLEDDGETDDQSMDTQISSNAPHPGYLWVTYRQTFNSAPVTAASGTVQTRA